MGRIKVVTTELIKNLQSNSLTKYNLKEYYNLVVSNFNEVINFEQYSDYRFAGVLFGTMLEISDFETDSDIRQSIASIGFYLTSKGMEKFCLEENNYLKPDKSIEQIELVSSRISLLLESSSSIKYSLRLAKPITDKYYTPLMDRYQVESQDYEDIILCDSYIVKILCSKPGIGVFMNEALEFANKTFERSSDYGNIQERVENGRNSQIRLYNFLKHKFEIDKEYSFE